MGTISVQSWFCQQTLQTHISTSPGSAATENLDHALTTGHIPGYYGEPHPPPPLLPLPVLKGAPQHRKQEPLKEYLGIGWPHALQIIPGSLRENTAS